MTASDGHVAADRSSYWRDFRRGFVAMTALWPGVVPFAIAYAALARDVGFSFAETVAFSVFVMAGSAQFAIVNLVSAGAGFASMILTGFVLNLRHMLYGVSLDKQLPKETTPPRPVLAFLLVDESFGLTIKDGLEGGGNDAFFWGSSVCCYLAWIAGTVAGAIAGERLANATDLGLDFVFPLTFLLLLVPHLQTRSDFLVAGISAVLVLLLQGRMNSGAGLLLAVLVAIVVGQRIPTKRAPR
jgi:4-azaleucine resistance transporter AzlC